MAIEINKVGGRTESVVMTGEEGKSLPPVTVMLQRTNDDVGPLLILSPSNTLGLVYSREELKAMRDFIDEILAEG